MTEEQVFSDVVAKAGELRPRDARSEFDSMVAAVVFVASMLFLCTVAAYLTLTRYRFKRTKDGLHSDGAAQVGAAGARLRFLRRRRHDDGATTSRGESSIVGALDSSPASVSSTSFAEAYGGKLDVSHAESPGRPAAEVTPRKDSPEPASPVPLKDDAAWAEEVGAGGDLAIPFYLCCLCFGVALLTLLAVPLTAVLAQHVTAKSEQHLWSRWFVVEAVQLLNVTWVTVVSGNTLCLFFVLPFALLYSESDDAVWCVRGRTARAGGLAPKRRSFTGRACCSCLEVVILDLILSGMMFFVQCAFVEDGCLGDQVELSYPAAVVTAVQLLPGLLLFLWYTPAGAMRLLEKMATHRPRFSAASKATLNDNMDAQRLELCAAKEKLRLLQQSARVGDDSRDDVLLHSARAGEGAAPFDTDVLNGSPSRVRKSADGAAVVDGREGTGVRQRRPWDGSAVSRPTIHLGALRGRDDGGESMGHRRRVFQPVALMPRRADLEVASQTRLIRRVDTLERRIAHTQNLLQLPYWSRLLMLWKTIIIAALSMILLILCALIAAAILVRAAMRPFVDVWSSVWLDIMCMLFFIAASVSGAYAPGSSLRGMRFRRDSTKLPMIVFNVTVLQLASFALPVGAWVLGLGSSDVMRVVSEHYGHIPLLRSTSFINLYNAVFVAVAAMRAWKELWRKWQLRGSRE